MELSKITSIIDHTALKPEVTSGQIVKLCAEAREYGFASVCVNPCFIPLAAKELEGSSVAVCTVIGFPLGANTTESKAFEAADAVAKGADEVDMVINVGLAKEGKWDQVRDDIAAVVKAAGGKVTKVILEVCLLTDEEIAAACRAAMDAGADFVKTSTGFSTSGATVHAVSLMRQTVGPDMGVKAAGGVRCYEDAVAMIEAGATRLGASSGVAIARGGKAKSEY